MKQKARLTTKRMRDGLCIFTFILTYAFAMDVYAAREVGFDKYDFQLSKQVSKEQSTLTPHQVATTANWYNDGNYSRNNSGIHQSVEQFVVVFSKAVKPLNASFVIIVPDHNNSDPYGEGRLGELVGRWDNKPPEGLVPLVPGGSLGNEQTGALFIDTNACARDDDFTLNLYKSYILELTADWTRLLNTSETGYQYWDARFNPIRLVVRGITDQFDQPLGDITASHDIFLNQDTSRPMIVHRELMVQGQGQYAYYEAGVMRFAFDEPVQILDSDGNRSNSAGGFTPLQSEEHVPIFNILYTKLQDPDGTEVTDQTVDGEYFGWNCLWPDDLTHETSVLPVLHHYDVDRFDQHNKIKQSREFGWHWVTPKDKLSPGLWLLQVNGAADDAGNVMVPFEIEVQIKGQFMTIDEISVDYVKVQFTEPHEGGTQILTVYSPLYDSSVSRQDHYYVLRDTVDADALSHVFYFTESFDSLPEGLWDVNGIMHQVGEITSVFNWELY